MTLNKSEISSQPCSWRELGRGFSRPVRDFSIRQLPRALLAEWKNEQFPEGKLSFIPIGCYSDRERLLWNIDAQGAVNSVPPTEHCAPVRVGFTLYDRMMYSVHARRDEQKIKHPLQCYRQPPVRMLELVGDDKKQFVDRQRPDAKAERANHCDSKENGQEHFA